MKRGSSAAIIYNKNTLRQSRFIYKYVDREHYFTKGGIYRKQKKNNHQHSLHFRIFLHFDLEVFGLYIFLQFVDANNTIQWIR